MVSWIDYLRGAAGDGPTFGWKSTAEEVTNGLRLDHLTVIITGATSGIGEEAARVLVARGARVVIGARDAKRGVAVKERLAAVASGDGDCGRVVVIDLDLSSFASVRRFASRFLGLHLPLNVLINNAGVYSGTFKTSEDGFEMNFATNHLGHFLLTELLMEKMVESAKASGIEGRIVNVSSCLHTWVGSSGIQFHTLNDPHCYVESMSYAQSKLANILHSKELARRLKGCGAHVTANSVHPGIVKTNITRNRGGLLIDSLLRLASIFMKSIPQGAATLCYVATHPKVAGVTGKYFVDCNEAECSASANDEDQARQLWKYSQQLIASAHGTVDLLPDLSIDR